MGSLNCYCCKKPEGKQEIETPESISLPANFLDTNVFNSNSNDMLTSQTVNSTVDKPYNAKRNFNDIYEEDEIDFREDNQ